MSSKLSGGKYSPAGSRVPAELLLPAIRYERARAVVFQRLGNAARADECMALKRLYERRAMEECCQ